MWIQSLALLSGLRIQHCHELLCRCPKHSSDLASLWLWCRPAAAAPNRPLAWEPPYPMTEGQKKKSNPGIPAVAQWDQRHLGSAGMQVWSPGYGGLRIQHYHCCGLGRNYGSDLIPGLGAPHALWQPKKEKKKKNPIHPHSEETKLLLNPLQLISKES